jgi:penicillin-binding protein 1C
MGGNRAALSRVRGACGPRVRRSLLALLAGSLVIGSVAWWHSLPSPLFDVPYSATLTDAQGRLLSARVADDGQWRFPGQASVPDRYALAAVAFEDRRFWLHPGVDPIAITRAVVDNARASRVVSGASTLSMQVIRLARGNPPRTLAEKVIEALLALRLELTRSKAEVLALYAAHAPYGGNIVGLEAAAWRYFGRPPGSLSWAEAALLAVLPNAPGLIHPGRSRDALRSRRDALLKRLHAYGHLDATELRLAQHEPVPQAPRPLPQHASVLLDRLAAEGGDRAYRTTLQAPLQIQVERIVTRHARRLQAAGVHNAAALVLDNRTMQVVAYGGNTGRPGMEGHGFAMDLVQAPRSTGSVLKPLLYAAMLEHGELQPGALIPDVPVQFDGFRPENFDKAYRGALPAREALVQSRNVPAVLLLRRHGVARFYALLRSMGMRTLFREPDEYGLSLILGGAEGTLFDLTTMYAYLAQLAADGRGRERQRLVPPALLEEAGEGRTREDGVSSPLGAGAAWLTLETLVAVNRPGDEQYWKEFAGGRRIAWKTGTSYGLRDGWAIGTTPHYTVGVWAGNATGEGRAGLTGTTMAAPILFDVFGGLDTGGWFHKPLGDLRTVQVCRNDGYLPSHACERVDADVPRSAHFNQVSRNHRWVQLDAGGRWRVHGQCESVAQMRPVTWFVLPPVQAYFYRRAHADYRSLPPWRPDCANDLVTQEASFDIVYPQGATGIYVPTDFGGTRGRVVLQAVTREGGGQLYWHLDGRLVATTQTFHEVAVDLAAGMHRLTIVDQDGQRRTRRFRVYSKHIERVGTR